MMRATYDEVHAHATACREALVIDDGGLDELVGAVPRSTTGRSTPAWRPSPSTSSPPSSTRPARPGAPRGACRRTATCAPTWSRTCRPCARCSPTTRRRCCSSARPHPGQGHRPRLRRMGHQAGLRHRHGARGRGAAARPADAGRVGAPGVREGVQQGPAQGPAEGPRPDLRQGRGGGHPLVGDATQGRWRPLTGAEHALFGRSSTARSTTCSATACASPSAAAGRSASGSPTSSTASACGSSRATA